MADQFLFFCVNIGNETLLKEEIKTFYPELSLSYSRKGFITFKNKGVAYDLESISQLQVTFSTRSGLCVGRAGTSGIVEEVQKNCTTLGLTLEDCLIHSFSVNTDYEFNAESVFNKEVNTYSANGKTVFDLIVLSEEEIWVGVHTVGKGTTRYPNAHVDISVPANCPSNSYLKLAQAAELYALKVDGRDSWLDFGSAPGGASLFLLSKGCKVWGIDPAQMSEVVSSHKNYTHISKSVQDLSQEELPEYINWAHVDLNLNPKQGIKEVLRLCKKYNNCLRGIIFTVQLVRIDLVELIEEFEDQFYDWGFNEMLSRQVPSHKQEYILIATRNLRH